MKKKIRIGINGVSKIHDKQVERVFFFFFFTRTRRFRFSYAEHGHALTARKQALIYYPAIFNVIKKKKKQKRSFSISQTVQRHLCLSGERLLRNINVSLSNSLSFVRRFVKNINLKQFPSTALGASLR